MYLFEYLIVLWVHVKKLKNQLYYSINTSEMINNFLLVKDKLMPEMHLKQAKVTYSNCRPFTKTKERMKQFNETWDSR